MANEGQAALDFTAALHSYFRVADIHQVHSVPSVTRACTYIHLQVAARTHQCQHDRTIAMRLRAVSLSRGPVSRWSWPNHPPRLTRAGTAASCHCTCMWTLCRWDVLVQRASPARQRPAGSCTSTCDKALAGGSQVTGHRLVDAHTSAEPAVYVHCAVDSSCRVAVRQFVRGAVALHRYANCGDPGLLSDERITMDAALARHGKQMAYLMYESTAAMARLRTEQ